MCVLSLRGGRSRLQFYERCPLGVFLISCISDLPGEGGFFSFPSKSFLLSISSFSKCLLTMDPLSFYYYENFNFTLVSEGIEFPSTSLGIDFYICFFFSFFFLFCSLKMPS